MITSNEASKSSRLPGWRARAAPETSPQQENLTVEPNAFGGSPVMWGGRSEAAGGRGQVTMPELTCLTAPARLDRPALRVEHDLVQKVIALAILIFFLPLMIAVAVAVRLQDGGPAMFRHRRVGQRGVAFSCLKFRSMRVDAEARLEQHLSSNPEARREWERDHKLRYDPRVTALGHFLRKSSLDELPQLLNVLRGEMNLVGPRPIVEGEIAKYGWRYRHYIAVKPGLTGLWQVSGRNDVDYRTRVAMDSLYSLRRCSKLDLWILANTIPAVVLRRGSY